MYNAGPGDDRRTATATASITGDSNTSPANAAQKSNVLFNMAEVGFMVLRAELQTQRMIS